MSTGNFTRYLLRDIYAIEDSEEYRADVEYITQNIASELLSIKGIEFQELDTWYRNSEVFGEVSIILPNGDRLSFRLLITLGYYSGANLDMVPCYNNEHYYGLGDIQEDYAYINNKRADKTIKKHYNRMIKIVEKVYANNCDVKLQVQGTFSNGEVVYSTIK